MPVQCARESIKITSNVKNIRKVSPRIISLLQERNIDNAYIFDIRLSVEETVLNAIEHGNGKNEKLTVEVTFAIDDQKIEISVEDQGPGFDHKSVPDPTKSGNILRSHGRGVYLVHKLMDKVEYNDKGNKVKLTKYFSSQPGVNGV
ncbi:MAG: ATP-binding protein [Candidatus Omnitrophota bacterium]